ncbi:hypothetical protein K7X08_028107 [Anisodus acutangulus]|uniref:Uncharacterized protein n=1 Tax=Anisodus acutangulus TaxID=402998 RepID=A0A9Q1RRC3_9SOLA|nr:hypothetical protein K7X08_028107 [Anisodus acutangulus]
MQMLVTPGKMDQNDIHGSEPADHLNNVKSEPNERNKKIISQRMKLLLQQRKTNAIAANVVVAKDGSGKYKIVLINFDGSNLLICMGGVRNNGSILYVYDSFEIKAPFIVFQTDIRHCTSIRVLKSSTIITHVTFNGLFL